MDPIETKIFDSYAFLLIAFGIALNLIVILVSFRLRRRPIFLLLIFMTTFNALTTVFSNLDRFISTLLGQDRDPIAHLDYARLVSLSASAWHLIAISMDRFLSILSSKYTLNGSTTRNLLLVGFTITALCLLTNLPVLFSSFDSNQEWIFVSVSASFSIYYQIFKLFFTQIHSFIYVYVPCLALFVLNSLSMAMLKRKQRIFARNQATAAAIGNEQTSSPLQISSTNRSVISISLAFIAFTLPTTLTKQLVESNSNNYGKIFSICQAISLTYHAILCSLLLLCVNKKIRVEFIQLLKCKCETGLEAAKRRREADTSSSHRKPASSLKSSISHGRNKEMMMGEKKRVHFYLYE